MFARWSRVARCQSARAVPSVCSATRPARLGRRRSTSLAQLPSGLLHLWTTPILMERGAGSVPLCEQLTRRALRLHEQHALQAAVEPIDDLDAGGSFYQWQCEQHTSAEPSGAYEEMVSSPEFERLRLLVHASVERYLGETADQAVGRACRAARATADECADLGSAFACKVTPSAKCEAAQERMDAEPARAERLRRLSTGAALLGAVAIAYFQHRAAAGV